MANKGSKKSHNPSSDEVQEIVRVTDSYMNEAREARRDRIARNRLNWDVYYGKLDWSHKQAGQSTEHLPKLAGAAEQMVAFVKRALTGFGDWFSVDTPLNYPFSAEQARALMQRFLGRVVVARGQFAPIHTIIANAVKQGLMESLVILKVHGGLEGERVYRFEPGDPMMGQPPRLEAETNSLWRLRVDIIPTEDFYPDPTGRGLYRIHEVERDYMDVYAMAEDGVYDMEVCKQLEQDMSKQNERDSRLARQRNQNETTNPRNRRRVVVRECWGTILGADGLPKYKDVVWTIANGKWLIRKPEPYPFWHGQDPFVVAPIINNPHTVWSKALYDDAASLNIALDELYNLILDAGIAGVWGVRQVRPDWLEDPRSITGGIPQNATLVLNDQAPADGKAVETVTTSQLPGEAIAVMNLTAREHDGAALTNDIRLGNFPARQVKATEVMEASSNSSVMLDSFSVDLERMVIVPMLQKAWAVILQFADDLPSEEVAEALGLEATFTLSRMHPAERYSKLIRAEFKVFGLSGTLARTRDFQKFMALLQAVPANPVLLEAFVRTVSGEKILKSLYQMLNINPSDLELTPEEVSQTDARMRNIAMLNQLMPQRGGSNPNAAGSDRSAPNEARSQTSGEVEGAMGYGGM